MASVVLEQSITMHKCNNGHHASEDSSVFLGINWDGRGYY